MIKEPKYKVCRRIGDRVYAKCQTPKFTASVARKTSKKGRGRKSSEYKSQLLNKQKVRFYYGITEKQFANYVNKAQSKKGLNPGAELNRLLESRLDSVLFSLGIFPSRALSRQVTSHGHILVNGKRVNVPSYSLKIGDRIGVKESSKNSPLFRDLDKRVKDKNVQPWMMFDRTKNELELLGAPTYEENTAGGLNFTDVIEFYSRA